MDVVFVLSLAGVIFFMIFILFNPLKMPGFFKDFQTDMPKGLYLAAAGTYNLDKKIIILKSKKYRKHFWLAYIQARLYALWIDWWEYDDRNGIHWVVKQKIII